MRGKVVSWLGDKGYGFIASDEGRGNQNIFFHLSNVKKAIRQPQVGDFVVFVLRKDDKGKFKAVDVILEGVPPLNTGQPKKIEPPVTQNTTKPIVLTCLQFLLVAYVAYQWFLNPKFTLSALVFPCVILIVLTAIKELMFNKDEALPLRPDSPTFACDKCWAVSRHDGRTIQAWRQGQGRFYCTKCHQKWLSEKPIETNAVEVRPLSAAPIYVREPEMPTSTSVTSPATQRLQPGFRPVQQPTFRTQPINLPPDEKKSHWGVVMVIGLVCLALFLLTR